MGSELRNENDDVVWGMSLGAVLRQARFGHVLTRLALPPDGADDGIRPGGPLQAPARIPLLSAVEPYRHLTETLGRIAVREEAVLAIGYDWRRSIEHAANALQPVVLDHLDRWKARFASLPDDERRGLPEPQLTFVCHSMGGLVARWLTEVSGLRPHVRRIITLGTPFAGSLNAVRVLATGDYLPFGLFARSLRESARTMPGLYELVARYESVRDGGALRAIQPADLASVDASDVLADAAFQVHRRLANAVAAAGNNACPMVTLVGTNQPTAQTVRFADGTAEFFEDRDGTDHRGDGTVYRYAASLKGGNPMPLPQSHGALAKTPEAAAFVEATLTERDLAEVQAGDAPGLRAPEAVAVNQPFEVEALPTHGTDVGAVTCRVVDTSTNAPINIAAFRHPAGTSSFVTTLALPQPGVYRLLLAGSGYSPVEHLVVAMADAP